MAPAPAGSVCIPDTSRAASAIAPARHSVGCCGLIAPCLQRYVARWNVPRAGPGGLDRQQPYGVPVSRYGMAQALFADLPRMTWVSISQIELDHGDGLRPQAS